ncbi:MAG TPA: OmpA family protein [Flavitalea sp.]|nr:OmpA family protein [Flavitalea sp.]
MNKLFFILVFLSLISSLSYGQIRIGLIGGPHSANVKETNDISFWETEIELGYFSKFGFYIGLLGEIPLSSNFFFQPGLMYMSKGRKYFQRNDDLTAILTDTISNSVTTSVNYIELPLNLAYKLPLGKKVKFVLSAGPYVGFFFNGKEKYETRVYSTNNFRTREKTLETGPDEGKVNTLDAGINGRAGFELGSLMISGFITQGLTNYYTAAYDGTFKHQVKGVSLSFWLNRGEKKKVVPPPVIETKRDTIVIVKPAEPKPEPVKPVAPDRDKDGVPDADDECPDLKGPVELKGCPIPDTDGDGLNDKDDQCPGDYGPVSNSGCPLITAEPPVQQEVEKKVNLAARSILFKPDSDELTETSKTPMNEVATILTENPTFKMVIEGHSDISGGRFTNKALSQKRAETVKEYLIQSGIEASRLTAIGYGSERPIFSNKTAQGRAKNRRVELKIVP